MTDPQAEAFEQETMPIDQGLSVSAPPTRQSRRGPRQAQARDLAREPMREDAVVRGRDGTILTRKRVAGIDPFHIARELIPAGWDYQWNTVTVYNNTDVVIAQSMAMYENGWRPVPAERHPGKFVPIGTKGEIIRDGMRLEERPISMTMEARAEDQAVARAQMVDRNEALMGGKAKLRDNVGNGFAMNPQKYRGTGGDLRMSIDRALDIPAPQYEPPDDSVS